jgi:glutamate racemase
VSDAPIGVLASDAAGLVITSSLRRALPREDILLITDEAYAPHARRSRRVVADRAGRLAEELRRRGAKLCVVGSLQITIDALGDVAARSGLPTLGLDATLPHAAVATREGRVAIVFGVCCVREQPYLRAHQFIRGGVTAVPLRWPGAREAAEHHAPSPDPAALVTLAADHRCDVLALVCPHTAAFADALRAAGPLVVVSSADVVAERARRHLTETRAATRRRRAGHLITLATNPTRVHPGRRRSDPIA